MIKSLVGLFLESIRVKIVKDAFEILPLDASFEKDKINPGKADLVDCYIIRKGIDIRLIYYKCIDSNVLNKGVKQYEWQHLYELAMIYLIFIFTRMSHE